MPRVKLASAAALSLNLRITNMNTQKPHIWIIDDDEDDLFAMRLACKKIDSVQFTFFNCGQDMLDFAEGLKTDDAYPKVILLDLNMPVLNGVETMRRFKELALKSIHRDHIPVIMHSTSNSNMDVHRTYLHGANGYMVKSQSLDDMVDDLLKVKGYWADVNIVSA